MKIKTFLCLLIGFFLFCITYSYAYAEKLRIGFVEEIDTTIPTPDFIKKNLRDSIRQNMVNSGKFEVVDRSEKDMNRLFEEMKFSDERVGRVDVTDEKKAEYGKIAGMEYMVLVTINDFFSGLEKSKFQTIRQEDKNVLRLGANLRLINTSTGKIKIEKSVTTKKYSSFVVGGGSIDTELANKTIKSLSDKIVRKIMDELYPISIVERVGNIVFINRGQDNGLKVNDALEVFTIKKVIDESTQEDVSLAYSIGKIKITNVSDDTSQAEIIEDFGVTKGCIAKMLDTKEETAESIKKDIDKKISAEDW